MKKIKVSEATGPVLDWMVEFSLLIEKVPNPEQRAAIVSRNRRISEVGHSTNWSQGGPIIEREGISLTRFKAGEVESEEVGLWCAACGVNDLGDSSISSVGPTLLIAAMRCYVTSKLGDEVEVPEELM